MGKMKAVKCYIIETLGENILPRPLLNHELEKLPLYIREAFRFYRTRLFGKELVLAEALHEVSPIGQMEIQLDIIGKATNKTVVLTAQTVSAVSRKRLVERGINFIVPGKQLFLPEFLIDFRENFRKPKVQKEKLTPSAQLILLYRILHRNEQIEALTFKELAVKLKYTPMAITKAVDNLKHLELCAVEGTKEKHIRFNGDIPELWHSAQPFLVNPVLKQVFVDALPEKTFLLRSNATALPEYSDMNESRQVYYAIEKGLFYNLNKNGQLLNPNEYEGQYCLEVWKYNPLLLAEGVTEEANVDPLSLYLSIRDIHDERIEMALEAIIEKYIW